MRKSISARSADTTIELVLGGCPRQDTDFGLAHYGSYIHETDFGWY